MNTHGVKLCEGCTDRIAKAKAAHKARVRVKARPRVEAKARAKMEREGRLTIIRARLLAETDGKCATCPQAITLDTMEAHHLVSAGLRRHRERVETMAPLCHGCHQEDGHNCPAVMAKLLEWCKRTGRQEAAREITRRLDKIARVRGET